jgi:hypothetical protein
MKKKPEKKLAKKLALAKETMRNLNEADMKEVAGGKPPTTFEITCDICTDRC